MSKVRISMTGPGKGEVYIDGVKVPHLSKFTLSCEAGDLNRLRLERFTKEVEFEGECEVTCLDLAGVEHIVTRVIGADHADRNAP